MRGHLELLQSAAKQGKLAHAYLLSGNDREAKEELVDSLFTALFQGPYAAHPDTAVLEPEEGVIRIGQVRSLKAKLAYSSWQGGVKAAVIRFAETMNQEAQSAFLKLLEEPRGNVVFLLLTEHASLLPETIRSRTQELRFWRFPEPVAKNPGLLVKLQKASLGQRFAFAKKEAENPTALEQTLLGVLRELRMQLFSEAALGTARSAAKLKTVQQVLYDMRSTNVNPRLAAERILLEL